MAALMVVAVMGCVITVAIGTLISKLVVGNDTVIDGVGVGCAGAPIATPFSRSDVMVTSAS